ncbi:MAG TPA: CvpA family protein [Gemmataceae bacterium]|nr:CvpA family protein [Gemmataceae bacterium]
MLLGFVTVVIMLAGAYSFWRQGVLPAFAMMVNVLLAGLVAFNFFEPIADQLDSTLADTFLHGYEDSFCLVALFSLTLLFLRWASNELIHTFILYHPILQQGGALLFGMLAGYLTAGFLICVAQTLPMDAHFLHFEARVDPHSPGAKIRRVMPPDRVWLALMHRASMTSFDWEGSTFDPGGDFEMRYASERRSPPSAEK